MRVIWATRGRSWGFRFLLDGGYVDPLPVYEHVFSGHEDESEVCAQVGAQVALRFPDPLQRRDAAGRVIPHDFVILEPVADEQPRAEKVTSVDDGLHTIWPLVADVFARVWDTPSPLDVAAIRTAVQRNSRRHPKRGA